MERLKVVINLSSLFLKRMIHSHLLIQMKSVSAGDFHAEFPWKKTITSTSTSFISAPVIIAEKIAKAVGAVVRIVS